MSKEDGVKTVVVGGKKDVQQEYCGTVGGAHAKLLTYSLTAAARSP
jgi:hypothetical protein